MDFDKPKVYGDTFISDGLVFDFENQGTKAHKALQSFVTQSVKR